MHKNLIFIGDENFIKTFKELKYFFNFNYNFQEISQSFKIDDLNIYILLAEDTKKIKSLNYQNCIILVKPNYKFSDFDTINLPCSIYELQSKIEEKLISKKYKLNSKIQVKNYFLDMNARTLFKKDISIQLTEKETKLIEILNMNSQPLKKDELIKLIWNYSSTVDTHTLETHIYRLRKKISDKFHDQNFILINENGYYI